MGIDIELVVDETNREKFQCPICTNLVEDPIQLKECQHLYCKKCIDRVIQSCQNSRIILQNLEHLAIFNI
mgnify:CR=1 FL=1